MYRGAHEKGILHSKDKENVHIKRRQVQKYISEHFISRHIDLQKGATKGIGAIKKNLQNFKSISYFEAYPLAKRCN